MSVSCSIFTCTYNMLGTLPRCVSSALAQTHSDFEFLILDDGSVDGTWEYLSKLSLTDTRIRLYRNAVNRGLSFGRNLLLKNSRASYYSILDADDSLTPEKLHRHTAILEAHPKVGVVWGSSQVYWGMNGENPEVLPRSLPAQSWDITTPFEVVHSSTTWRRDAVIEVGGYDPKYVLVEGPELFLRIGDRYQQHFDNSVACTKYVNPNNEFRKELTFQKRKELSREILLNTIKRRHHVFVDKRPIWAGSH